MSKVISFLIVFLFHFLLLSCISTKKYRALEAEKNLLQAQLSTHLATLKISSPMSDTPFYKKIDLINLRLDSLQLQLENSQYYNRPLSVDLYRNYDQSNRIGPITTMAWKDNNHLGMWPDEDYYSYKKSPDVYLFPIPPPKPSDQILISDSLFSGKSSTIADMLSTVLNGANIGHNYFDLEDDVNGFAITTYLQEYDENTGITKREIVSKKRSGLWDLVRTYLTDLWLEKKGYYRMFVFVITDAAISTDGPFINYNKAADLKVQGPLVPSPKMQSLSSTKKLHCYCLLYDFIKTENNKNPDCNPNSKFSIKQHLTASNFYQSLKQYHATNH